MKHVVFAVLIAGFLTIQVKAQSASTGTVIGTVTDPSGAVVPAAVIDMTDVATGISRKAIANSAGQYSFPGVQPGTYSVRASHTGFEDVVVPRAVVEVGKSYTINLELRVGSSQQVVEVTATPG